MRWKPSKRLRWALLGLGAVVVLAAGGIAAYVIHVQQSGRDIAGSSTVEFVAPKPVPKPRRRHRPKKPPAQQIVWPTYGYDDARRRSPTSLTIGPPLRKRWMFRAKTLLEFPPAVGYGKLYIAGNDGLFFAIDRLTGKLVWHRSLGRCVAASPALASGLVIETFLNKPPCNRSSGRLDGEVIAFSARTGKIVWRRTVAPTESSPLVVGRTVYVGDWAGGVYSLRLGTGRVNWRASVSGKVKSGIAYAGGRLYFGTYSGHVYCLAAGSGKQIWRASAQPRLGSTGTFYSTPAVAYGRVYIGSTDGKVYSFGASTGKLRWSHSTGGYVYGSPAVAGTSVLVGSYSSRFSALDAATGAVRWTFKANGRISGSATVIHGIVYFATLKQRTYGLDLRTGKQVWTFPDGKYTPVVADATQLYVVGYTRVYGLAPPIKRR